MDAIFWVSDTIESICCQLAGYIVAWARNNNNNMNRKRETLPISLVIAVGAHIQNVLLHHVLILNGDSGAGRIVRRTVGFIFSDFGI